MVFLKEEAMLLVDFSSVDESGLLPATFRYAMFLRKPSVGDWVRLDDAEGHSCRGRIKRITGELIEVAPVWETWTSESKTPSRFSSSYEEYLRTEVRGAEDKPSTVGIKAQLHLVQVGD